VEWTRSEAHAATNLAMVWRQLAQRSGAQDRGHPPRLPICGTFVVNALRRRMPGAMQAGAPSGHVSGSLSVVSTHIMKLTLNRQAAISGSTSALPFQGHGPA
jgi:hypothetical protein